MRAGLLAVLALSFGPAVGLAGCSATTSGPSASLNDRAPDGASEQHNVRTATPKTRASARVMPAQPSQPVETRAQAGADVPTGTTGSGASGRSAEEIRRANAAATAEADRREDERMRSIMMICANCGMSR